MGKAKKKAKGRRVVAISIDYFRQQGHKGGKAGAAKRWADKSPEEKAAHARMMVQAREAKRRAARKTKGS